MAISKSFSLDKNKKYAVMLKVSDDKGITIKHDGVYKAVTKNTWKVLNKISDKETTEVSFIGNTPDVNVLLYVIEITSKEFEESNNEVQLLKKYNDNYKQSEISIKLEEIDVINFNIENVDEQINLLKHDISIEENFTDAQIKERNQFIYEQTWEDGNYYDDQELYDDAIKKFEELKVPKLVFDISIVNFLEVMEEQRNWDKLSVGDKVLIHYERFNINVEAIVLEIHYDFENQDISLTIANVKDVMKDEDKLAKFLYDSYSTSNTVDMSKYRWTETERTVSGLEEQINGEFDATKRRIIAGADESVEISNRGMKITSPSNPLEMLIANAGVIALSDDGGDTFNSAIVAGKGVIAERVVGKLIIGVNLLIENESGKFTFDQNGVVIDAASFTVKDANGNNLLEVWNKAITEGENYNGVIISPTDGIVVQRSDNKTKTTLNATEGIKIENSTDNGATWNKLLYADTNGTLHAKQLVITDETGTGILIDGKNKSIDFSKFTTTVGTLKGVRLETTGTNGTVTIENDKMESIKDTWNTKLSGGIVEAKSGAGTIKLNGDGVYFSSATGVGQASYDRTAIWYEGSFFDIEVGNSGGNPIRKYRFDDTYFSLDSATLAMNTGDESTNFDHIWFDDADNSYHFVSDAAHKATGNAQLRYQTAILKEIKSRDNTNSIITVGNGVTRFNHNTEQYWYSDKSTDGWWRFKIGDVFLKSNGTNILEVRNNADDGMAAIKASNVEVTSDIEAKKNIEEFKRDAISILKNQMKVHEYVLKDDKSETKKIGLIAQETTDLISSGTTIDLYAMNSLTVKVLQEVIERLEFLENRYN